MSEVAHSSDHGGPDMLMDRHLIDCLRHGRPLDQDVCDAPSWSSIVPLSQWSALNRSNSIEIPDFTTGSWESNPHNMDIDLTNRGGTVKIIPDTTATPDPEDKLAQQWVRNLKQNNDISTK